MSKNIINIGGLDCYEENGVAYLNLEQVAHGLGFTRIAASGNEVIRWERVNGYLRELGFMPTSGYDDCKQSAYIPENVFYRLAMKAKNPVAEKFQAWVADEVIPSIRRTGGYIAGQESMTDDELVAAALIVANRRIQERERRIASLEAVVDKQRQEIAALEPVSRYVNEILASVGTVTATQIAADYSLTAQKLNKILREDGIQRKVNGQWILCMAHIGKGYVKSVTVPIERTDGRPDSKMYTRWTQKGRLMIHNLLARRGIFANVDKEN